MRYTQRERSQSGCVCMLCSHIYEGSCTVNQSPHKANAHTHPKTSQTLETYNQNQRLQQQQLHRTKKLIHTCQVGVPRDFLVHEHTESTHHAAQNPTQTHEVWVTIIALAGQIGLHSVWECVCVVCALKTTNDYRDAGRIRYYARRFIHNSSKHDAASELGCNSSPLAHFYVQYSFECVLCVCLCSQGKKHKRIMETYFI